MKRYRVEVVEIETGNVVSVIGHNLSEDQAERRIMTGLSRFDTNRVFIRDVEESATGPTTGASTAIVNPSQKEMEDADKLRFGR